MIDTSIIERKIYNRVMDMCFSAVVTEAFIGGLPINESDMSDELTENFVKYASECLNDLGGSKMLASAMEGKLNDAQRAYLEKFQAICMETAQSVTSRILKENKGDDEALREAADKVTLTPSEYKKFSSAASSLTPESLSKMIQKKTLDTIKEEKEAYKKDAELETEIISALNDASEDEEDANSAVPLAFQNGGDQPTGADIGQASGSGAQEPTNQPTADSFLVTLESFGDDVKATVGEKKYDLVTNQDQVEAIMKASQIDGEVEVVEEIPVIKSGDKYYCVGRDPENGQTHVLPVEVQASESFNSNDTLAKMRQIAGVYAAESIFSHFKKYAAEDADTLVNKLNEKLEKEGLSEVAKVVKDNGMVSVKTFTDGKNDPILKKIEKICKSVGRCEKNEDDAKVYFDFALKPAQESHFVDTQNGSKKDPAQNITGAQIGQACPCPNHQKEESAKDPVKKAVGKVPGNQVGQQGMFTDATKSARKEMTPADEGFKSYMKSIAGENYRERHASIFSRLQELAYESIIATTELYDEIPFATMAQITKENTFKNFGSHRSHNLKNAMESVANYDFTPAQELFGSAIKKEIKNMPEDELIKTFIAIAKSNVKDNNNLTLESNLDKIKKAMASSPDSKCDFKMVNGVAVCIEYDDRYGRLVGIMINDEIHFYSFKSVRSTVAQHLKKQKKATESVGTPDDPEGRKEQLDTALMTASIIYTFFETLNTMNLYCPKLNEIKDFVDETIPVKSRVELDKKVFIEMLNKAIDDAKKTIRTSSDMPIIDDIQKDMDIVREKIAAPGFDSIRKDAMEAIDSLQQLIDQRRDYLVEKQRPSTPAVESSFETLARTRDIIKFDRTASLMLKKPNVASIRYKVDPQGNSRFVAAEAFNANGAVVNRSTIALESVTGDLVDYVTGALKSSKVMEVGKKAIISDKRSGKIYFDSTK